MLVALFVFWAFLRHCIMRQLCRKAFMKFMRPTSTSHPCMYAYTCTTEFGIFLYFSLSLLSNLTFCANCCQPKHLGIYCTYLTYLGSSAPVNIFQGA